MYPRWQREVKPDVSEIHSNFKNPAKKCDRVLYFSGLGVVLLKLGGLFGGKQARRTYGIGILNSRIRLCLFWESPISSPNWARGVARFEGFSLQRWT
jgi:hypothetical protein